MIRPTLPADRPDKFSFLTGALHIISPAGIFLSAPYAESLFSLLNFIAMYLYAAAHSKRSSLRKWQSDVLVVLTGLTFGLATTVRSNGLLSGLVFAFDDLAHASSLLHSSNTISYFRRLCVTTVTGITMALVAAIPQYLAYVEYCRNPKGDSRPWCSDTFPSIYSWVQRHYWSVGFVCVIVSLLTRIGMSASSSIGLYRTLLSSFWQPQCCT